MCLFVMPTIGMTLPFFSYGGSSLLTLYAAMGVVSGIKKRSPLTGRTGRGRPTGVRRGRFPRRGLEGSLRPRFFVYISGGREETSGAPNSIQEVRLP